MQPFYYVLLHLSFEENGALPEDSGADDGWVEEKMFCHHCDDSLAGHRYVLRDDHPYCIKCYENVFANNCDECGKLIGIDSKARESSIHRTMLTNSAFVLMTT